MQLTLFNLQQVYYETVARPHLERIKEANQASIDDDMCNNSRKVYIHTPRINNVLKQRLNKRDRS